MQKIITTLAATLFGLLAPAGAHAADAAALTDVRIEVPSDSNRQFFTLWVAMGAGYFQEEGLSVKILVAPTPRAIGQKLLQGDADVALLPPPMFLGMMAQNQPIRLFASLLSNEPINLVAQKTIADARKLSRAAPLRDRLQAMKGLRIGLAGEVAPRLRALFAAAGMNADTDVKLITIAGPDQVQAFENGDVDMLFAHTPYLETVLVRDQAVLIADTSGGEVAALAGGQVHALATTAALAASQPKLIQAVDRAIDRSLTLIHSDPQAAVNALASYGATGTDRNLLEAIVAIYGPAVPQTSAVSLEGIRRDVDLYPAHPAPPDFTRTNAADFVAAQFAEDAAKPRR